MIFVHIALAQTNDTAMHTQGFAAIERITKEVSTYKPDTTSPPADKITQKIIELRKLRGGFNVNEAIAFKLEEDRQKGETPADVQKKFADFFTTGSGKRWLDNATIWLYRNRFSYAELKQLVKFYKTSAGQKMAADFPIIMLESLAAAQMLKDSFEKELKAAH
ncbi:hypothetical protein GCM10023229_15980 [Flavisolibacter ginsenosidimutans]